MPSTVVVDFEATIHNAVRIAWTDVVVVGCRFHLRQSWFRQIQKLGLQTAYGHKDSLEGKWLR